MKVTDRQGRKVKVGRRWLPWRRRLRDIDAPALDFGGGDDPISAVLAIVGLILAIPFLLALVLLLSELFLLVLLLPLVLLVRILLRRPWTVEATHGGKVLLSERVRGWEESGARVREIAVMYQRGQGAYPVSETSR
jgi:hypothetical protein